MVGDRAASVREAAGAALLLFGAAATPALAARITGMPDSADPGLLVAVRVLARIGDDRALDPLESLLKSRAAGTRVAAAEALGDLGLSPGIPALRAALADEAPDVRRAAIRSIAAIAGPPARPVIEDYIRRETDPELRRAARAILESL